MSLDRERKERIAAMIAIAVAVLQIILSIFQLCGLFESTYFLSAPLSCVLFLLLAYSLWRRQRKAAIVITVGAGVMFCMFLASVVLRLLGI